MVRVLCLSLLGNMVQDVNAVVGYTRVEMNRISRCSFLVGLPVVASNIYEELMINDDRKCATLFHHEF